MTRPAVRVVHRDILALSPAAHDAWLENTNRLNHALFGRPISSMYYDRRKVTHAWSMHAWDGEQCVARANLAVVPLTLKAPNGAPRHVHAVVGGGGTLPGHERSVSIHPFVMRTMVRIHRRQWRRRGDFILLATNLNPVATYIMGQISPRIYPHPSRPDESLAWMRRALLEQLYPEKVAHFDHTGFVPGPTPPDGVVHVREGPSMSPYLDLHSGARPGDRLPVVVRMNKRDIAAMAFRAIRRRRSP